MTFWTTKKLDDMTPPEWEALCDGCGKCCRVTIEVENVGAATIYPTALVCNLLDADSCSCSDYGNRFLREKSCQQITPENVLTMQQLPSSCAYVRVARGQDLEDWHPLKSGSRDSVHLSRASIRHIPVVPVGTVPMRQYSDYIIYEEGKR